MKKVYLLLTLAVLFASTSTAQETEAGTRFGIKLAPNLSWIRSDTRGLQNEGNRLGLSLGLMAEFPIGPTGNYRFSTGLFLTNIGGVTSYSYNTVDSLGISSALAVQETWKLRYLEVPITIKMMTNEIGYFRYYGQLGISPGVNVRARVDQELITTINGVATPVVEEDLDVQDNVNALRAALLIGGGAEYNFSGQTTLLIGITYHNSIIDLLDIEELPGIDREPRVFADYLELTLGIFF